MHGFAARTGHRRCRELCVYPPSPVDIAGEKRVRGEEKLPFAGRVNRPWRRMVSKSG